MILWMFVRWSNASLNSTKLIGLWSYPYSSNIWAIFFPTYS